MKFSAFGKMEQPPEIKSINGSRGTTYLMNIILKCPGKMGADKNMSYVFCNIWIIKCC